MDKLAQQDMGLGRQSRELALQYRHASSDDRAKIKRQVVEVANKQFDVRQQRRTLELKRMEKELKRLSDLLDRRAKARDELVKKRVLDLLGPEESDVQF